MICRRSRLAVFSQQLPIPFLALMAVPAEAGIVAAEAEAEEID